jgi:hypothetical protein
MNTGTYYLYIVRLSPFLIKTMVHPPSSPDGADGTPQEEAPTLADPEPPSPEPPREKNPDSLTCQESVKAFYGKHSLLVVLSTIIATIVIVVIIAVTATTICNWDGYCGESQTPTPAPTPTPPPGTEQIATRLLISVALLVAVLKRYPSRMARWWVHASAPPALYLFMVCCF